MSTVPTAAFVDGCSMWWLAFYVSTVPTAAFVDGCSMWWLAFYVSTVPTAAFVDGCSMWWLAFLCGCTASLFKSIGKCDVHPVTVAIDFVLFC